MSKTKKKPDLSGIDTETLVTEVYNRHRNGECVAFVVTTNDLSEYFGGDEESGQTDPSTLVPDEGEMNAVRRSLESWLDHGGYETLMETLFDAWMTERNRKLQEGKR